MMTCRECGKEVWVPGYRVDRFACCSRACLWRYRARTEILEKNCAVCGKSFPSTSVASKLQKYCSRGCYYKSMAQRGSIIVACSACSAPVACTPHRLRRTSVEDICCSVKCRGQLKHLKMLARGPSESRIRVVYLRDGLLTRCEVCGIADERVLVVHHRDRNRRNNATENLAVLCANCHMIEHHESRRIARAS